MELTAIEQRHLCKMLYNTAVNNPNSLRKHQRK